MPRPTITARTSTPPCRLPRRAREDAVRDEREIRIVPINTVDAAFINRLAPCLEERFLVAASVERSLVVPRTTLTATRGQLFRFDARGQSAAHASGRRRRSACDHRLRPLQDVASFRFRRRRRRATVSRSCRCTGCARSSTAKRPTPTCSFSACSRKRFTSSGMRSGLKHCYNARCAMYYSNSIFETDNKVPNFCEVCDRCLARARVLSAKYARLPSTCLIVSLLRRTLSAPPASSAIAVASNEEWALSSAMR